MEELKANLNRDERRGLGVRTFSDIVNDAGGLDAFLFPGTVKTRWGQWRLNEQRRVLSYFPRDGWAMYEIDLDELNTNAKVLDRIMQLNVKLWMRSMDMRDLLFAIRDILPIRHPQIVSAWWFQR
jgi:hypothetical protein